MMARLAFAVPGDLATPTGGYVYDRRLLIELGALGYAVEVLDLGGNFPRPRAEDQAAARAKLASVAEGIPIIVDGLALGVLPEVAAEAARTHPLIALVHHPLALETGLSAQQAASLRTSERAALAAACHVVATSEPTADILCADYGVPRARISVARPGSDPVAWAEGSADGRVHLLSVGALVPRKGYDVLVAALATISDLPWRFTIVGDCSRSPPTAAAIKAAVVRHRLSRQITVAGPLPETALAAAYRAADVFALASRFEGYGMACAEAIAYGLPVVGTTVGAIPHIVPSAAGVLVPPDDALAFADALRRLIGDGDLRRRLRAGARAASRELPSWQAAAQTFARVIADVT